VTGEVQSPLCTAGRGRAGGRAGKSLITTSIDANGLFLVIVDVTLVVIARVTYKIHI
jgi:hypothetical protein